MFNLHVCWILFAVIFLVETGLSFYLDLSSIPTLVEGAESEDPDALAKGLASGINIKYTIKTILQQSLIFATYKTVEFIVFSLQ